MAAAAFNAEFCSNTLFQHPEEDENPLALPLVMHSQFLPRAICAFFPFIFLFFFAIQVAVEEENRHQQRKPFSQKVSAAAGGEWRETFLCYYSFEMRESHFSCLMLKEKPRGTAHCSSSTVLQTLPPTTG